jgi:hypothetical protein
MDITLTNLDSCQKVTHKYILHLGKFSWKHAQILAMAKCKQVQAKSPNHIDVHSLTLLVDLQGYPYNHHHQRHFIFYHHFFGKSQHLDSKKSLFHFVSMLSTSFMNCKCLLGACVWNSCQGFGTNSQVKSSKGNQIKFMSLNLWDGLWIKSLLNGEHS